MSSTNNNSELMKDHEKKMIEFDMLLRRDLELEFSQVCSGRIAGSDDEQDNHNNNEDCGGSTKGDEGEEGEVVAAKGRGLGEFEVGDGDDDGFRTPTSLDHKIMEGSQCPPAPRKPKSLPLSTKRKLSPSLLSSWSKLRHVRIDLAEEIELLFPPAVVADLGRKIKKVRGSNEGMS